MTGFLGPNGAGKSTTMRLILGPGSADARQRATVQRQALPRPGRTAPRGRRAAGGPLQSTPAVPAYNHLLALAQTHGIARTRVDEVIELVGLEAVARKRVGSFSLGMGQRLGVASALLGDPATVVLDEPANGLDPEGIRWIRNLLRGLAAEGRTVFLSSHLMSEMEQTAEHLIVIGRGRLIADTDVASFVAQASSGAPVRVRSPQQAPLAEAIIAAGGGRSEKLDDGALQVFGLTSDEIGEIAAAQQLVLHELTPLQVSLEDAFMRITKDSVEFQHAQGTPTDITMPVGAAAGTETEQ